jgi:hypothetical protein
MVNYPIVPNGTIDWYVKEYGKNGLGDIVSHQPGVHDATLGAAMGMARVAAANLSAHHDKGHARIEVDRHPNHGKRTPDWYVYLTDTDPGGNVTGVWRNQMDRSAMSIEFGWTTKKGKEVPGLHILGGAMKRAVARYRGPK